MRQEELILLAFKVVLVADLITLALFAADYTKLTRFGNFRNPIGRTIVIETLLLGAALTPSVLSLFFRFNRLTSHIAAWIDIVLFAAIAVVMGWRCFVFEKIHRDKRDSRNGSEET